MSALDWFRTRRDLIAELAEARATAAEAQQRARRRAVRLYEITAQLRDLRAYVRRLELGEAIDCDLADFIDHDSRAERGEP